VASTSGRPATSVSFKMVCTPLLYCRPRLIDVPFLPCLPAPQLLVLQRRHCLVSSFFYSIFPCVAYIPGGRLAALNDGCYPVFRHILIHSLDWLGCAAIFLFRSTVPEHAIQSWTHSKAQVREHQTAVTKSQEDASFFPRESGAKAQEVVIFSIFILEDTIPLPKTVKRLSIRRSYLFNDNSGGHHTRSQDIQEHQHKSK
jgi:hypothetical protein